VRLYSKPGLKKSIFCDLELVHRKDIFLFMEKYYYNILYKEANMASGKPKKKNPRLASGRKRARQDVKLNAANTSLRSKYRTAVKNVEKAVASGDKAKATDLFAKMQAVVDTVADKGIFHKNKAARDKSRLSAKVKALATAA